MRLLLDTHIWLWSLLEPERLARRVARMLENPSEELWLSPISVWEVGVLVDRKRVRLKTDVRTWLESALQAAPLLDAALTREVALETANVTLSHRDPADRFLAATARHYGLTLLTSDERLLAGKGFSVLANR